MCSLFKKYYSEDQYSSKGQGKQETMTKARISTKGIVDTRKVYENKFKWTFKILRNCNAREDYCYLYDEDHCYVVTIVIVFNKKF